MSWQHRSGDRIGLPEVGLAILGVLSVVAGAIANVGWVIVFDSFGWDTMVPSVVFTSMLPSLTVAVVPAIAARYTHGTDVALKVGATIAIVTFGIIKYISWTSISCMTC